MSSQVLYRKWRPQTLSDVVGQEHVTRTLANAIAQGKVAHAYLFCGPRGTGKTSTARVLAKAVNCATRDGSEPCNQCPTCQDFAQGRALDLVEIDAASNRGIDEIRSLRDKVNYAPAEARYKVYIIDEVHMLTDPAFNALLKTLEEPPGHAIFVLATTEPHRVPATIISRCQRFDFRRISQRVLMERLSYICEMEGLSPGMDSLDLIARSANGGLRDAENILEQLVVAYGLQPTLAQTQELLNLTGDPRSMALVKALLERDVKEGLSTIIGVSDDGLELRQFGREVVELLRALLLIKSGAGESVDLGEGSVAELNSLARSITLEDAARAVKLFSEVDFRGEHLPSLPLEIALLEYALGGGAAVPAAKTTVAKDTIPSPQPQTPQRTPAAPAPSRPPAPAPQPASSRPTAASPAKTPVPEKPPQPPAGDGVLSLEEIREIVKQVRIPLNRFIEALLRNGCTVEAVEGNNVVLNFKHPSHKERMEQPSNLRLAEAAISALLGRNCTVRCVMLPQESASGGSPPRSSGHLLRAAMDMGASPVDDN